MYYYFIPITADAILGNRLTGFPKFWSFKYFAEQLSCWYQQPFQTMLSTIKKYHPSYKVF